MRHHRTPSIFGVCNMSNLLDEISDSIWYCPICQAPLIGLKIKFSTHISMCNVSWDNLQECTVGINCDSNNIFHYRDYSHQVLAAHRETVLSKRKRNDEDIKTENSKKPKQKENKAVSKKRAIVSKLDYEHDDDDDDIFMPSKISDTISKSQCSRGRKTLHRAIKNHQGKVKRSLQETKSEKTDKLMFSQQSTSEKDCINSKKENDNQSFHDDIKDASVIGNKEERSGNVEEGNKAFSCDNSVNDGYNSDACSDIVLFGENESTLDELSMSKDNLSVIEGDERGIKTGPEDDIELSVTKSIDIACEKKEKCKAEWKDIFKVAQERPSVEKMLANLSTIAGNKKKPKNLPYYKKIPGTGFAVDAFQYGDIPEVTTYFLSHFHSDHYIGLKKSFSFPLYCSLITANLVKKKIRVSEQYIRILEFNKPIVLNRVEIECFDANHCPGSLILLFRLLNGEQYLHVGDFRASPDMENEPILRSAQISRLYLDTTYFDPQYVFPTQEDVVNRVRQIAKEKYLKHPKALFITGSYLIGKEKVFLGLLDELQCKLWAQPAKREILKCLNDNIILSALTDNACEAKVHVLPMNYLQFDKLQRHLLDSEGFSHVFAFKPTGWEMGRSKTGDWLNVTSRGNITIYGVPYSEHSSYEELCRFINFVKADKVIPTVPLKNRNMYGHLKTMVDTYKVSNKSDTKQIKQQNIRQYVL